MNVKTWFQNPQRPWLEWHPRTSPRRTGWGLVMPCTMRWAGLSMGSEAGPSRWTTWEAKAGTRSHPCSQALFKAVLPVVVAHIDVPSLLPFLFFLLVIKTSLLWARWPGSLHLQNNTSLFFTVYPGPSPLNCMLNPAAGKALPPAPAHVQEPHHHPHTLPVPGLTLLWFDHQHLLLTAPRVLW